VLGNAQRAIVHELSLTALCILSAPRIGTKHTNRCSVSLPQRLSCDLHARIVHNPHFAYLVDDKSYCHPCLALAMGGKAFNGVGVGFGVGVGCGFGVGWGFGGRKHGAKLEQCEI